MKETTEGEVEVKISVPRNPLAWQRFSSDVLSESFYSYYPTDVCRLRDIEVILWQSTASTITAIVYLMIKAPFSVCLTVFQIHLDLPLLSYRFLLPCLA